MTNGLCITNWEDEQVCEKYVQQIKTENEWVGFFCNIYNEKEKGEKKLCDRLKNIHGYIGTYRISWKEVKGISS